MYPDRPPGETSAGSPERGWARARTAALLVVAGVAVVLALRAGRALLVPVALAVAFAAILQPPVAWLAARRVGRRRVPVPLAAAAVVLALVGVLGTGAAALEQPLRTWLQDAPATLGRARARIDALRRPVDRLSQTAERPASGRGTPGAVPGPAPAVRDGAAASAAPRGAAPAGGGAPAGASPSDAFGAFGGVLARAFGTTAELVLGAATLVLLLYFLLAGDERFLRRAVALAGEGEAKRHVVAVARGAEQLVRRYFVATLAINVVQGAAVALAVWALGVPSPLLWGAATAVLELLPYVGGAVMIAALAVAGLATSRAPGHALAAPGAYLLITTLQNNLVSPVAYGRTLRLNPVAILVSVLFWGLLWGVAGVVLAVPITGALRVLAEEAGDVAPLRVLAAMLAD